MLQSFGDRYARERFFKIFIRIRGTSATLYTRDKFIHYTSHTYTIFKFSKQDDLQVVFNGDFEVKNVASTGIRTHDLSDSHRLALSRSSLWPTSASLRPTHVFPLIGSHCIWGTTLKRSLATCWSCLQTTQIVYIQQSCGLIRLD